MGLAAFWSRLAARWPQFRFRRYQLDDVPRLLRSPIGRAEVGLTLLHYLFPVTSRIAALYRRLVLRRTHVVVVVGTFGKTTTTHAVLAALGRGAEPVVDMNSRAMIPIFLFGVGPSTPTAVLEVGIDGPGQMTPLARTVQPDIAVVTSVGSEHNDSFKNLDATREEKANMVRGLASTGLAILNGDDPNVLWMASQTRARVVTYGFGESAQVRASEPRLEWPFGTRFRLHAAGQEREVVVRLMGRRMIYPILAAVAVALEEGHSLDEIVPRLAALAPAPGRLDIKTLPSGAVLVADEFKSPLETIHNALDVLEEIPAARKIVVIGLITQPMGSQKAHYRALAARIAQIAHCAVFVESYGKFKAGVRQAGMKQESLYDPGADISKVVEFLRRELRAGDVVLVKGRSGQKMERIVLALEGRKVGCSLTHCNVRLSRCDSCPMLEKGG